MVQQPYNNKRLNRIEGGQRTQKVICLDIWEGERGINTHSERGSNRDDGWSHDAPGRPRHLAQRPH